MPPSLILLSLRTLLRVAVVCVAIFWLLSKSYGFAMTTSLGNSGVGVVVSREGFTTAILPGRPLPTRAMRLQSADMDSWHEFSGTQIPYQAFLGFYAWQDASQTFKQVGVTHLAALVTLLVFCGALRLVVRRQGSHDRRYTETDTSDLDTGQQKREGSPSVHSI